MRTNKPNDMSWLSYAIHWHPTTCAVVAIIITMMPVLIWGGTP